MNSYELIEYAREQYYLYLFEEEGEPILLETLSHPARNDLDYVWPSSLGLCPMAAAKKRLAWPQSHPPSHKQNMERWSYFELGVSAEDWLTQAVAFALEPDYTVIRQIEVANTQLMCRGYADLVVAKPGEAHLYEIKRPVATSKPTVHYALQTLFYGMTLRELIPERTWYFNLLMRTNRGICCWQFKEENPGFYFLVDLSTGEIWADENNEVIFISEQMVRDEIATHHSYLDRLSKELPVECPIKDPVNEDAGWQCIQRQNAEYKIYKTRRNAERFALGRFVETDYGFVKPGVVQTNCPWFCHSKNPGPFHVYPGDTKPIADWENDDEI